MPRTTRRFSPWLVPAGLLLCLAPGAVSAAGVPLIDFRAQLGYWGVGPTGVVSSNGDDFDVEDDLDFDRASTGMLMAEFEHPVPLIPNVRLQHVRLDDTSNATISSSRRFGPVTFQSNEPIRSSYDLELTDATFYYSPLNNWVALDLGITARRVDVQVEIESRDSNDSERAGGEIWLPLAHVGARFQLPLTGLYASGSLDAISAGGESMRDVRATLGWEATDNFGLEIGYRRLSLDFDEVDDLTADIDFEGPFAAATLRF